MLISRVKYLKIVNGKNKKYHFTKINGKKVFKGRNALKHVNKVKNWLFDGCPGLDKNGFFYLIEKDGYTTIGVLEDRSRQATDYLIREGFKNNYKIDGGSIKMDKIAKSLKDIKRENEAIITFTTTVYYNSFGLLYDTDLVEDIHKADLGDILEYTLSRLIEEEFTEDEVFFNSGMYIPSKEELEELEEYNEFTNIDLGYLIKGLIISIKEEKINAN